MVPESYSAASLKGKTKAELLEIAATLEVEGVNTRNRVAEITAAILEKANGTQAEEGSVVFLGPENGLFKTHREGAERDEFGEYSAEDTIKVQFRSGKAVVKDQDIVDLLYDAGYNPEAPAKKNQRPDRPDL